MAPTTPGSSRLHQRELRVAEHSEGAQAQVSPLSSNTNRKKILPKYLKGTLQTNLYY